jgi:hypothetical protein
VGSLGELVQQKLAVEFGTSRNGGRRFEVSGIVLACHQVDAPVGSEARVKLDVTVRDRAALRYEPAVLEKVYEVSRPVGAASPSAVVRELSRCVEEIAARIAEDVAALPG